MRSGHLFPPYYAFKAFVFVLEREKSWQKWQTEKRQPGMDAKNAAGEDLDPN